MFAQTNIQFYNQLLEAGYDTSQLELQRAAYELSTELFTGRRQPVGKSFVAHCVGVAGILARLGRPPTQVAAGLLHNVYTNGDFGFGERGIDDEKRRCIREALGEEVEADLETFHVTSRDVESIADLSRRVDELEPRERRNTVMHLADVVEHFHSGAALLYGSSSKRIDYFERNLAHHERLSRALGYPQLATALAEASEEQRPGRFPEQLRDPERYFRSVLVLPPSVAVDRPLSGVGRVEQGFDDLRPACDADLAGLSPLEPASDIERPAQTPLELYRQLIRQGSPPQALGFIREAHELAFRLVSCKYRPSGKPNIHHGIGTASILASIGSGWEVVAAGLLHHPVGASITHLEEIRRVVGAKTADLLVRYSAQKRGSDSMRDLLGRLPNVDPGERELWTINLADRLEDTLDRGVLYTPDADQRKHTLERFGDARCELAAGLGHPVLAERIRAGLDECLGSDVPACLRSPPGRARIFSVLPKRVASAGTR